MPESAPKRELSCGDICEIDGGIADADVGISEIEGTGVGVDIGFIVDDVGKEESAAADTVSNSCFGVACRAARGLDGWDAILGDTIDRGILKEDGQ